MKTREHWDAVYGQKAPDQVSWYRPSLDRSLQLIDRLTLPREAPIIDVGAGASTLIDDLLERGYTDLTALDVSAKALEAARFRLGEHRGGVRWIVGDVAAAALAPGAYALWHDRAMFHFFVDDAVRARYVNACRAAVRPGGHILVATFGPDGPERCSGLPVRRYDVDQLHAALGRDLKKIADAVETHLTPWGAQQAFVYGLFETPRT